MAHEERCNALDILEYAHQVRKNLVSGLNAMDTAPMTEMPLTFVLGFELKYKESGWWHYGTGVLSQDREIEACWKFMGM